MAEDRHGTYFVTVLQQTMIYPAVYGLFVEEGRENHSKRPPSPSTYPPSPSQVYAHISGYNWKRHRVLTLFWLLLFCCSNFLSSRSNIESETPSVFFQEKKQRSSRLFTPVMRFTIQSHRRVSRSFALEYLYALLNSSLSRLLVLELLGGDEIFWLTEQYKSWAVVPQLGDHI